MNKNICLLLLLVMVSLQTISQTKVIKINSNWKAKKAIEITVGGTS